MEFDNLYERKKIARMFRDISLGGRPLIDEKFSVVYAEYVISLIYGAEELELQKPLTVREAGEAWEIEGSLGFDSGVISETGSIKGSVTVYINKSTGEVLSVMRHGRVPPAE